MKAMNKYKTQAVVTAVVALGVIAGVVVPIQSSKGGLEAEIAAIEAELAQRSMLQQQLSEAHQQSLELRDRIGSRAVALLPDTPQSHQAFETRLIEAVQESGVNSVRLDRRDAVRDRDLSFLKYEQQVEGDAERIYKFLAALDEMPWVTRVHSLSIEPGDEVRRMSITIAVVLEPQS